MTPPPMPLQPGKGHGTAREDDARKVRMWVILNLGAFPGLGTILARRWEGFVQAAWTLVGFVVFVMGIYRWGRHEVDLVLGTGVEGKPPDLGMVWWGLACTAFAWVWSGWSSWRMWEEHQAQKKNNPTTGEVDNKP